MKANPGKNLVIEYLGLNYDRLPIRTHLISDGENIIDVVKKYVGAELKEDDIVVISERVVAISQGRSYKIDDIHPGWWAKKLYPYVYNHPGGIGLRSPWTMQLAIQEAGLFRILLAGLASLLTKPFGIKGMFYIVAGHDINAIDGPCDYSLPPSDKSAKLGPKDPQKVAKQVADALKKNVGTAIIDANDYGVRVMGYSKGIDPIMLECLFVDNPMGQSDEQTPIVIVRKSS